VRFFCSQVLSRRPGSPSFPAASVIKNYSARPAVACRALCTAEDAPLLHGFWHADCLVVGMADEDYLLVLLQIVCLLMFSCGFVVLTQYPE